MSRNASAGTAHVPADASFVDELVHVEIGGEVLLELGDAIVVRGRLGRRRTLVVIDDGLSAGDTAHVLRELSSHLVETLLRELVDDRRETL